MDVFSTGVNDLVDCVTLLKGWGQFSGSPQKDTLNSGHLSNEDSAYCPSYIEMCTKLPLKHGHLSNEDSACCHS